MRKIPGYDLFQQNVLATFKTLYPPEKYPDELEYCRRFCDWLLEEHCKLLERYALYQEFKRAE